MFCYRYHQHKKKDCIGATFRTGQEIQCLLCADFLVWTKICLFYPESPHPQGGGAVNDAKCKDFLKGEAIAAKDLAETGHEVEYCDPCPDANIDDNIPKGDCVECPWMKKHCASTCLCIEETKDLFCSKNN